MTDKEKRDIIQHVNQSTAQSNYFNGPGRIELILFPIIYNQSSMNIRT